MKTIDKQKVLDVINSLEVVEVNGGEDAYMIVDSTKENIEKLNAVGVGTETIMKYGDETSFCILALAYSEGYANGYKEGKFILHRELFAVYDSEEHDTEFFDTYSEALKHYEGIKDSILGDEVSGDERVYLLEVRKVASLVEDKSISEDPKEYGYDFWVKWQDREVGGND